MNNGYSLVGAVAKSTAGRGNPISTSAEALIIICAFFVSACYGRLYGAHLCGRPCTGISTSLQSATHCVETIGGDLLTLYKVAIMSNLILMGQSVRTLDNDLYSLQDIFTLSGSQEKDRPALFMRSQKTQDLIEEIKCADSHILPVKTLQGRNGGTYACKELVIAYANWISPKFYLHVIRTFLTGQAVTPTLIEEITQNAVNQAVQPILLSVRRQLNAAYEAAQQGKDPLVAVNDKYTHGVVGVPKVLAEGLAAIAPVHNEITKYAEVK